MRYKMDPTTAAACILVLCLALVVFAYALGLEQGRAARPCVKHMPDLKNGHE